MTAKTLLEVALRIQGIWFLYSSISTTLVGFSFYYTGVTGSLAGYAVAYAVSFFSQLFLGIAFIVGAPWIASRFYPPPSDPPEEQGGELKVAVGPGDIYRVACFVLGVFLLVQVAEPAGRLVIAGYQGIRSPWQEGQLATDAVTVLTYTPAGILLVFGSRRISELLSHMRYDADTIPQQHLSLFMLLAILVLIAVVLGVVRSIVLS